MSLMTLVLDAHYTPLTQVSLRRAARLIAKGKVEVLECYENIVHEAIGFWPSVVRLLRAVAWRHRGVRFSRENVYARDRGRCQYCAVHLRRDEVTYDHVVPRTQGGKTEWTNIVLSCRECNQRKGGRTPTQAGMRLKSTPVRPKYLPEAVHIAAPNSLTPASWLVYLRDVAYWHTELEP